MHNEWVQGKVLAIGSLHYNSKESMHKKILMKIEIL